MFKRTGKVGHYMFFRSIEDQEKKQIGATFRICEARYGDIKGYRHSDALCKL